MSAGRWDVVLRMRSSPSGPEAEVVKRGPAVVLGTQPGAGGLALSGGRGVAGRHCTITARGPGDVVLTPIGDNPVRVAPYAEVRWEDLEPIRGPVALSPGAALHLGTPGPRGVTVIFDSVRDLGVQAAERLTSDASEDLALSRPPDSYDAVRTRPSVGRVIAGALPDGRFQVAVVAMLGLAASLVVVATVWLLVRVTLPPAEPPAYFWKEVQVADWDPDTVMHAGFDAPIYDFVVAWNRRYARGFDHPELSADDPSKWDPRFFGAVVDSVHRWSRRKQLFKRFDEIREPYAAVVSMLRSEGLPEVLAAVPMTESCYMSDVWSSCCARGYWQFMPEFGARFRDDPAWSDVGVDVRECRYRDAPGSRTYTPDDKAPPPMACARAGYVSAGACNLSDCAVDFRTDLARSTRVAMSTLGEALNDPTLAASGAAVQIAIASHHAGYDDRPWYDDDTKKPWNLLPAYERWFAARGERVPLPHFYGDAMRCPGRGEPSEGCQSYMVQRTQGYAVRVIAQHLMAVCYYAKNYPETAVFQRWTAYTGEGGFCEELDIPTPASLARVRVGNACPR